MSTRTSRLGKNTLLVFFGNIGSKVIGLIMLPFYTSFLSVEDYGLTDVLQVYVSLLFGIVTCCIGESLFIFPKGLDKNEQKKYITSGTVFLFITLLIAALLFGLLDLLFQNLDISNSFADNIWLIFFLLLSQIFQQILQQITRSIDKMKIYSITGIVGTASTAILGVILVPLFGIKGFVWSIIISNALSGLYSFIFSSSYKLIDFNRIAVGYVRAMLKYSIPLIPNGIMWWLVSAMNRPLMEHHLGLHDMGIYAVANKIPGILSMIFTIFATSWQISVLEEFGKDDYERFYNRTFKLVFGVLLTAFLGLTIFSKVIIGVFAASEFYEAWKYAPLLTFGVLFSNISTFAGPNFSATKESKYYFYSSIWGATTAVGLNFILIPMIGIWGACASVGMSFVAMSISRIAYGWKYVRINDIVKYILVIAISMLFMVCYIFEFSIIYILIMLSLSVISVIVFEKDEIFLIMNLLKSKISKR